MKYSVWSVRARRACSKSRGATAPGDSNRGTQKHTLSPDARAARARPHEQQPNLFSTHRAPSTVLAAARALRQPREVGTNVTCVSKTRKPRPQEVKQLTQDDATGKRNPRRLVLQPSRLTTTLGCLRPNTEPQKLSVSTPATLSQKIPVRNSSREDRAKNATRDVMKETQTAHRDLENVLLLQFPKVHIVPKGIPLFAYLVTRRNQGRAGGAT